MLLKWLLVIFSVGVVGFSIFEGLKSVLTYLTNSNLK